jgi:phosphatidylinositol alpha-1,6-mannosyltransferase
MAQALAPVMSPARPIPILPSGVDLSRFHSGVSDAAVRARHGLHGATVIACVSRLVPRKGQDRVIQALARLSPAFASLRALIVGGGPDGRRLQQLARQRGVSNRVVFAGEVSEADLPAYFRCGDIFAMPCRSRWLGFEVEALGAVCLQAAAVGRPVIVGRSGGAPEAIVDGETGFVVDAGEAGARTLEDALETLLRDPVRARAMGASGADRIRRSYSWDQMAARVSGILAGAITAS